MAVIGAVAEELGAFSGVVLTALFENDPVWTLLKPVAFSHDWFDVPAIVLAGALRRAAEMNGW
jgi:hypothetical protein